MLEQLTLASSISVSRAMTGANRPRQFKLSLSFLKRKEKRENVVLDDVHAPSRRPHRESVHFPEFGLGDILQDIAEESEEQLQEKGPSDLVSDCLEDNARGGEDRQSEENDEQNLTTVLVPKALAPLVLHKDSSLVKAAMSYMTCDAAYPPGRSPPSRRKTERSSSMKALDASTRSGSLRTESPLSQMSTAAPGGGKGWLRARCGFGSCSKQIDTESELRSKVRAAHEERHRSQGSRTKSRDPAAWKRVSVSDWSTSVLADVDDVTAIGNTVIMRKRQEQKKSNKLAPSPSTLPSEAVQSHAITPEIKSPLRDAYEEVREAAKYDMPSQRSDQHRAAAEVDGGARGGRHMLDTSTDLDGNTGGDRVQPWERSFSSPSRDEELFTTSFELDGQSKCRRKKPSSSSSDETDGRQRPGAAAGSHIRFKSTWSNHSLRSVVQEDDTDENYNTKASGKQGSRIIFLSTPPRPPELGVDDDEPTTTHELPLKTLSDRFGEYSKLELQFERTYSMGSKSNHTPVSFEADMEANAKPWSKLDLWANRGGESFSDVSLRELPVVSRSKKAGKYRFRQIDVQIEDQLVNLRLESDVSDSSQGTTYTSSRRSRSLKFTNNGSSKVLDVDKLAKKKRGHNRRSRGRKAKAPPRLPSDLHGKVKESVAVVKSSYDPYTDFRDSMVEMIVEKEIQGAADLEELLRCYLSLNAAEYHSVIVKVFADVWGQLFADAI